MNKVFFLLFALIIIPNFTVASEGNSQNFAGLVFGLFVLITLLITYFASKKSHDKSNYYAAGEKISGLQNGLAIAGDYMSAASFLGISGLVFFSGFDGLIYSIGFLVGWPIILFLIAEKLKNLGKYTFADVTSTRLKQSKIRLLSASGTLITVIFYLIAQMVGAGSLIQILFGLPYYYAIWIVGMLMIIYVSFGGMIATTWVQIIKAILLIFGATILAILVLNEYSFSISKLLREATIIHPDKQSILYPGKLITDPISAISLGVALIFGTAGLPHILMRFFTVPDAKSSRISALYATTFIGYFYILTFVIGFGAIVFLTNNNNYLDLNNNLLGSNNMAAIHLSHALGGNIFLGFISAVAFATILAVVSGLTLAGASAIGRDLYVFVLKNEKIDEKKEILVSKISSVFIGIIAIFLGIIFEGQNVAFMVGLAFAVAASTNFPILYLTISWKGLTTNGALYGGFIGLFSAIILVILGPTVWVETFGFEKPIFPYKYPGLFSLLISFFSIIVISLFDKKNRDIDKFKKLVRQSYLGRK